MKLKHFLRYPFSIRTARKCLGDQGSSFAGKQPIVLDLYTDQMLLDCGRHLGCIAAHASRIGSPVILRCSRVLLSAIANKILGPSFLSMSGVSWVAPSDTLPSGALVLSDVAPEEAVRDRRGVRFVQMLVGRDRIPGVSVMPYPMHPNQITDCTPGQLDYLRKQPKAGLFFAGNQKDRYGREAMSQEFGVVSRLSILSELKSHHADRIAAGHANGDMQKIVLRDSALHPIAPADWMEVISQHQFFLCCPGAAQPVCHNAIESMAAGVIPLIEYGDRFSPGLTDGVNAICFRGLTGLREAITRIDRLTPEEVREMSQSTSMYYDRFLDGARFLKNARDHGTLDETGCVSMPFHDKNLYSDRSVKKAA